MICQECRKAADDRQEILHLKCEDGRRVTGGGRWCDCQHKFGREWLAANAEGAGIEPARGQAPASG